jgi:hypothetical protein
MKIKPFTADAVNTLKTLCPCGDDSQWVVGVQRTITVCPSDCEIPWVNYSNIGSTHYGFIKVIS